MRKTNRCDYLAEYRTWAAIKTRCFNKKSPPFKYYGGRGITVCDRWKDSFDNFLSDMGKRPSKKHSIDRINVNGNYEPSNCRWATTEQQANNKTSSFIIDTKWGKLTIAQAAKKSGIYSSKLINRVKKGFSSELLFKKEHLGTYKKKNGIKNEFTEKKRQALIKHGEKRRKPVYEYTKNWEFIKEHSCVPVAANNNVTHAQYIYACCRGDRKTALGNKWSYDKNIKPTK